MKTVFWPTQNVVTKTVSLVFHTNSLLCDVPAAFDLKCSLKRHGPFVTFYFYCKIMLISISYNYCSVLTANKCFIETELTS